MTVLVTGEAPSRLPGGGYAEEEVARGLQAVALHRGNTRRASAQLKSMGAPIPRATLQEWKRRHVAEYERARRDVEDRIWAQTAEEHLQVTQQALKATGKAVEKMEERLRDDDVKGANTAASAARNAATVAGICNDKAAAAHGRPTEIPAAPDVGATIAALARMGVLDDINNPALQIDAEVVTEEPT